MRRVARLGDGWIRPSSAARFARGWWPASGALRAEDGREGPADHGRRAVNFCLRRIRDGRARVAGPFIPAVAWRRTWRRARPSVSGAAEGAREELVAGGRRNYVRRCAPRNGGSISSRDWGESRPRITHSNIPRVAFRISIRVRGRCCRECQADAPRGGSGKRPEITAAAQRRPSARHRRARSARNRTGVAHLRVADETSPEPWAGKRQRAGVVRRMPAATWAAARDGERSPFRNERKVSLASPCHAEDLMPGVRCGRRWRSRPETAAADGVTGVEHGTSWKSSGRPSICGMCVSSVRRNEHPVVRPRSCARPSRRMCRRRRHLAP